jgi:broad specificity polyphosphatase/5'/3'-nucleotidase SurE
VERQIYYASVPSERARLQDAGPLVYHKVYKRELSAGDTDASVLHDGFVAVTPLSLDLTSRIEWDVLRKALKGSNT